AARFHELRFEKAVHTTVLNIECCHPAACAVLLYKLATYLPANENHVRPDPHRAHLRPLFPLLALHRHHRLPHLDEPRPRLAPPPPRDHRPAPRRHRHPVLLLHDLPQRTRRPRRRAGDAGVHVEAGARRPAGDGGHGRGRAVRDDAEAPAVDARVDAEGVDGAARARPRVPAHRARGGELPGARAAGGAGFPHGGGRRRRRRGGESEAAGGAGRGDRAARGGGGRRAARAAARVQVDAGGRARAAPPRALRRAHEAVRGVGPGVLDNLRALRPLQNSAARRALRPARAGVQAARRVRVPRPGGGGGAELGPPVGGAPAVLRVRAAGRAGAGWGVLADAEGEVGL
ncbi:hypothetical protein BJ912DRAFT_694746, partial [Pholiota molesta]